MQPQKKEKKQMFSKLYNTSVKASYFNHIKENKFTMKSKLEIEEEAKEEDVDENTFRIMTGFAKPDDSYLVYNKKGRFYIDEQSFFSCLANRRRYEVQLTNFKLRIGKNETNVEQFFNFDTEAVEVTSKGRYFIVSVESCNKKFYFEPVEEHAKDQIVDDWVSLLNKAISTFEGKSKHYVYLQTKNEDWHTQEHISHVEFQKNCNSLDLVLFKCQHSAASVQRIFTDSEYDHVGVVVRNKKNEIFIFESSSGEGVGLTPWKHVVKFGWYNSTDKIAWRRLNIKLSPHEITVVEAFLAKTLGKEFDISLDKLFTFNSVLKRDPEEETNKTYFCSQLVARLYKQLGLLDGEKSSARYYPVDFSDKGRLGIQKEGVSLEAERVLAFNL